MFRRIFKIFYLFVVSSLFNVKCIIVLKKKKKSLQRFQKYLYLSDLSFILWSATHFLKPMKQKRSVMALLDSLAIYTTICLNRQLKN